MLPAFWQICWVFSAHSSVWHGKADIVIKSSVIKVKRHSENRHDDIDVDGVGDDHTEKEAFSDYDIDDDNINSAYCWSLQQALVKAVVIIFCEGNKEKSLLNKFIATEQTIIIWYNVGLDILLSSEKMSILSDRVTGSKAKLDI